MLSELTQLTILQIIADQLSVTVDDITIDSKIVDDLGADSLDIVELIDKLEKEFQAEISDSDVMKIKTISDILDYIENNEIAI